MESSSSKQLAKNGELFAIPGRRPWVAHAKLRLDKVKRIYSTSQIIGGLSNGTNRPQSKRKETHVAKIYS
jgi:hypothetical protein